MYDYGLTRFVRAIEERKLSLYGALVHQHGRNVGEVHWVNDQPQNLYSLSKSFASTAIGIAVEEGLIKLTDRAVDILAADEPKEVSERLSKMTLHDVLIMAGGHDRSYLLAAERAQLRRKDWVRYYLEQPMAFEPGERFVYDTGNTYLASAMLKAVAGETLLSYAMPRLFEPLGIAPPRWDACPRGITLGGAGLYLTLQDVAKLGLLYLNKGMWNGRRIVSEDWVKRASQKHIDTFDGPPEHDGHYGYGYQFWRGNHGTYRGDGAYGQFCIVLPEWDAVVTIHSREYYNIMAILQAVWDTILPDLQDNM